MAQSGLDILLGRLLVKQQVLDQAQLDGLTALSAADPTSTLGIVLVESGILTQPQVDSLTQQAQELLARRQASEASAARQPATTPVATPTFAVAPRTNSGVGLAPVRSAPLPTPAPRPAATVGGVPTPARPQPAVLTPARPGIVNAAPTRTSTGSTNVGPAPTRTSTGSTNVGPAPTRTSTGSTNVGPVPTRTSTGSTNVGPVPTRTSTGSTNVGPAPTRTSTGSTQVGPAPTREESDSTHVGPAPTDPSGGNTNIGPAPTRPSGGNTNVGPAPTRGSGGNSYVGPAPRRGGLELIARAPPPPEPPPPPVDAEIMDLMLEPVEEEPPPPKGPEIHELLLAAQGHADPKEEMELMLRVAAEMAASDFHLHSDCRVHVRINGELVEQKTDTLQPARNELLIRSILTAAQQKTLEDTGDLDFAYTLPGVGRFRSNAYRQQRGVDAVFRFIPAEPPTLEALGLDTRLAPVTAVHKGLVLFTGPSACGKSTTMAAMIRFLNERRSDHIITVEDPIEFLHKPIRCAINQRQVGLHTESYVRALRGALREDPDVIVVGELRDLASINLALSAAETGHLVLGTLTTANATGTVNRLINAFPADQQNQARGMVSESLSAVVSQRLCNVVDGSKRVAAMEIMLVNKAISNLIRENKTTQIRTIMQTSSGDGMCTLDNALASLVQNKLIAKAEAARFADEPRRFAS